MGESAMGESRTGGVSKISHKLLIDASHGTAEAQTSILLGSKKHNIGVGGHCGKASIATCATVPELAVRKCSTSCRNDCSCAIGLIGCGVSMLPRAMTQFCKALLQIEPSRHLNFSCREHRNGIKLQLDILADMICNDTMGRVKLSQVVMIHQDLADCIRMDGPECL